MRQWMQASFSTVRPSAVDVSADIYPTFSDALTRAAIHVPTSKNWQEVIFSPPVPTDSSSMQLFGRVNANPTRPEMSTRNARTGGIGRLFETGAWP